MSALLLFLAVLLAAFPARAATDASRNPLTSESIADLFRRAKPSDRAGIRARLPAKSPLGPVSPLFDGGVAGLSLTFQF